MSIYILFWDAESIFDIKNILTKNQDYVLGWGNKNPIKPYFYLYTNILLLLNLEMTSKSNLTILLRGEGKETGHKRRIVLMHES